MKTLVTLLTILGLAILSGTASAGTRYPRTPVRTSHAPPSTNFNYNQVLGALRGVYGAGAHQQLLNATGAQRMTINAQGVRQFWR